MITLKVDLFDVVVGLIIFTFFLNKKKKGDEKTTFLKLDSICKITLVIGKNNNVNTQKRTNVKK